MDCPSEATVVLLLQGQLGDEQTRQVEEHADVCTTCHALMGRLAEAGLVDTPGDDSLPAASALEPSAEAATLPPPSTKDILPTGTCLGRYVVRRLAGVGGMGAVYAADDPELGRQVAIKLLHPGRLTGIDAEESRLRLLREGRALAALDHPNVIAVHDVGRFGDSVFLAMDLVEGRTLQSWLRERPRSWREVLRAFVGAGRGLAAAHAANLVHRDFKPENVLIDDAGRVRVTDFGLARSPAGATADPGFHLPPSTTAEPGANLTRTGTVLGTPRYMAPEQRSGAPPDPRTDQYSFCLSLYEALFGQAAVPGSSSASPGAGERDRRRRVRTSGSLPRVPHWLRRALLPGLRVSPGDRYPSMDALLAALLADPWRRRRRWMLAAGVAVVVAGAAALPQIWNRQERRLCTGSAEQLVGVWDPGRRRALRAAFLATKKPYARSAWRGVAAGLDRYAHEWVLAHTEACAASLVRGVQPASTMALRMRCLDARRIALRSVVHLLGHADARMVERGLRIVGGLPDLSGCASAAALAARQPEPSSPQAKTRLDRLRGELAGARVRRAAGRIRETRPVLKRILNDARNLGYRPFEARALLELGMLQADAARDPEAVATLHRAAAAAQAGREDLVTAQAWTMLVNLVGARLARRKEGEMWARYAQAAIHRLGGDALLEARLLGHQGEMASVFGHQKEALRYQQRALALREGRLGPDHLLVASSLNVLGITAARSGRYGEAAARFERVLAIRRKALGPRHPSVSHILNNLGNLRRLQGILPEALQHHRRALMIREDSLGKSNLMVAQSLGNLANVLNQMGRHDEALANHRRALRLWKLTYGPTHPEVAAAHGNLAETLAQLGRYSEAMAHRRKELAIDQSSLGAGHGDVGMVLDAMARILRRQGRLEEATAHHRRAVEILKKALRPGHPDLAGAFHQFGITLAAQGKLGAARQRLERALAIRRKALRPRHPELAQTLVELGEVELRARRSRRAQALAEEAVSILKVQRVPAVDLARARFLIARILWVLGKRGRAGRLAQRTASEYRVAGQRYAPEQRKVLRWLARHPIKTSLRVGRGR